MFNIVNTNKKLPTTFWKKWEKKAAIKNMYFFHFVVYGYYQVLQCTEVNSSSTFPS